MAGPCGRQQGSRRVREMSGLHLAVLHMCTHMHSHRGTKTLNVGWVIPLTQRISSYSINNLQYSLIHCQKKSAKTLPLEVQQPVTWGKPLKGHLCALSTHKRCILVP